MVTFTVMFDTIPKLTQPPINRSLRANRPRLGTHVKVWVMDRVINCSVSLFTIS